MANGKGNYANDSVCKLTQNDDLAKTLNTVRTVPGAANPFVSTRQEEGSPNGKTDNPGAKTGGS
jgi:hypothetical protein